MQQKKFAPKRSLHRVENSASLLKQLPSPYLGTITVLFNRYAREGQFFKGAKIAKDVFLSKDGAILCGDTFYISPSKKHMAIMYSYPNRIPLPLKEIQRIKGVMQYIQFDSIYGFYAFQNIIGNARSLLEQSLQKYI